MKVLVIRDFQRLSEANEGGRKGWVRPVIRHLHLGGSFCFFILNILLCSRLGSDKFHFSVGLRFACEFRAQPLPSCCVSTHLPIPSQGQGVTGCPELRPAARLLGLAVPPACCRPALHCSGRHAPVEMRRPELCCPNLPLKKEGFCPSRPHCLAHSWESSG